MLLGTAKEWGFFLTEFSCIRYGVELWVWMKTSTPVMCFWEIELSVRKFTYLMKFDESLLWIFNDQEYEYFKSGKYLKIPKNAVLQYYITAQTLLQLTWGRGISFWWKNLKYTQLLPFAEFHHVNKIQSAVLIFYLYLVAVAFKYKFCHDESFHLYIFKLHMST